MQKDLAAEMEQAAERLEFERAAASRDRIRGLTHVQGSDGSTRTACGDADVVALPRRRAVLRAGLLLPRRPQQRQPRLLPRPARRTRGPEVLAAFLAQFYDDKPPPPWCC